MHVEQWKGRHRHYNQAERTLQRPYSLCPYIVKFVQNRVESQHWDATPLWQHPDGR